MSNSDPSNKAPIETNLPGGAIRMQFGQATDVYDPAIARNDLAGGVKDGSALRVNGDGSLEQHGGVTRYSSGAPAPDANVLNTAETPWGTAASSLNRETILNFDGEKINVKTALAIGWLRSEGDRYVVTGKHATEITALRGTK
ncbi:MAG: hypothetical protein ACYC9Z_04245 [Casimicrobiaceae bacterium]